MELKLGLQMFSVRNAFDKDFVGTLEKIAEIGYKIIQPNSFQISQQGMTFGKGVRAPEFRKQLDKLGLRAVSAHFLPTPDMRLETIADDLKTLGADTLACAAWFWTSKQEVIDWAHTFNEYGETLKKLGIQLYYHNHFHEFQVFEDKSAYEILVEECDQDLVMFEFDTYWAVRGGQDPIYWMKKLGRRCDLIHQKDLAAETKPVILFEKFGYDTKINIETLSKINEPASFTEVEDGILNIPAYIQAARQYNQAKYIFIEQDYTSRTEMESITISLARMKSLLAAK